MYLLRKPEAIVCEMLVVETANFEGYPFNSVIFIDFWSNKKLLNLYFVVPFPHKKSQN